MASTLTRRPLPALISLLALLVLVGIVWYRVANRDGGPSASAAQPSSSHSPTCTRTSSAASPAPSSPSTHGSASPVPTVAASAVTVRVLNATNRSGIAGDVRSALIKAGFSSPDAPGNDTDDTISGVAQIRYDDAAGERGAELLRYYLPGAELRHVDSGGSTVTVSLGSGYSGVASAATVTKQLAHARAAAATARTASPSASPSC